MCIRDRNAIFHLKGKSQKKSTIRINAIKKSGLNLDGQEVPGIELSIKDNGGGVPAELEHLVHEPFFSSRGGMGLGLTIMEAAAEAHDGSMSLDSQYTKSCTVRIFLPLKKEKTKGGAK